MTRRHVVMVLVYVFALMPFGVLTYASIRADDNADLIRRICESDNRQDTKQRLLWNGVIALTANNPSLLTPAQQAEQLRLFRGILDDTYKPQDCA